MRLREAEKMVAEANPVDRTAVVGLPLRGGEEEMLARILDERATEPTQPSDTTHGRRRAALGLAAGLACAVLGLAVALTVGDPTGGGARPPFAAAAVRVAEANPRLLVTKPGWSIVHARGFEVDSGELIYSDGSYGLELDWYPARFYRSYLRDRADVSPPVPSTLLGRRATTVHYREANPPEADYATILAPQGKVFIEIRGALDSKAAYQAVLRSLRPVDVNTWLRAMPAEVLRPKARSAAIAQMLRGIPVPPGFDAASLQSESALPDRFILGKTVTGAVACEWLGRWLDATQARNRAAAKEAVDAMNTARHWPILLQMIRERGYQGEALPPHGRGWPSEILSAAEEIDHGHLHTGPAITKTRINGRIVYGVGPQYPINVLGCDLR